MAFNIYTTGQDTSGDKVVYYVSYGLDGKSHPEYFTPNMIKANLADCLGVCKVQMEKHYRGKLRAGHAFKVTVMFPTINKSK